MTDNSEAKTGPAQEAGLVDLFKAWCASQDLVCEDAEEMLHREDLTAYQREWLSAFSILWDKTIYNDDGSCRV